MLSFIQIHSVVTEEKMFEKLLTTTDADDVDDDDDGRQVMRKGHLALWAR